MSTIRKTISISKKDEKLQKIVENIPSYEVSHVIRGLMYDGLKYRALVEQGIINDDLAFLSSSPTVTKEKEIKEINYPSNEEIMLENSEFEEEIDYKSIKLEKIDEKDEDLEDILLKNS